MTQEEKQLLLKDLCARLPYEVIVKYKSREKEGNVKITSGNIGYVAELGNGWWKECKPYLRSIDSMTKEEKEELKQLSDEYLEEWTNAQTPIDKWKLDAKSSYDRSVFYNSHHLDWNGLIEKGLAIAVTENNNPYKE